MTDTDEALAIIKTYEWACWSEHDRDRYCVFCGNNKEEGHAAHCRVARFLKNIKEAASDQPNRTTDQK